jgi:hypothetical protein
MGKKTGRATSEFPKGKRGSPVQLIHPLTLDTIIIVVGRDRMEAREGR